jgi:hypothetical protein
MYSYYGPSCGSKNNLSCVNYTNTNNNNSCQFTTTTDIIEKTQNGGERPVQNNYCFNDLTECTNNITYFQCHDNSLRIKSMMSG